MDLITTGVSASERMRRESLLSTTRNIIMEKMQLGGPSMRLLEVCKIFEKIIGFLHSRSQPTPECVEFVLQLLEELKKQISGSEVHLNDVSKQLSLSDI